MKTAFTHFTLSLVLVVSFLMPVAVPLYAQQTPPPDKDGWIIPCGSDYNNDGKISESSPNEVCHWQHVIILFNNVITALIQFSTILFIFSMIAVGFPMMFSESSDHRKELKKRMMGFVKGYVAILLAWVVIYTVLNTLVEPKYFRDTFPSTLNASTP